MKTFSEKHLNYVALSAKLEFERIEEATGPNEIAELHRKEKQKIIVLPSGRCHKLFS